MKIIIPQAMRISISILILLSVFQSIFPYAIIGNFMSLALHRLDPGFIGLVLYLALATYLVMTGHKGGWFMSILFISTQLLSVLFAIISWILSIGESVNEYFGGPNAVSFLCIIFPFVLSLAAFILLIRKSTREKFGVSSKAPKSEDFHKNGQKIFILGTANLVVLLIGSFLYFAPLFLLQAFLPNLILVILALTLIRNNMVAGYYFLAITSVVRLFTSSLLVIYGTTAGLIFIFHVLQALTGLITLLFLLKNQLKKSL